ncbi:hypothetical protein SAMN04515668_0751 [Hymenobacter arizonensis]|uniref:Uncharacterized protein n=1 Tax=Hymenobacter arizonensis TaxID=1227077 RepID=A0A1I5U3V6_HYMAR|nr:hypothetical protein SAMN04515668_0751 [Hymenobacter arizonensis]
MVSKVGKIQVQKRRYLRLSSPKINGAAQMDRPAPIQQLCQIFDIGVVIGFNIVIIQA